MAQVNGDLRQVRLERVGLAGQFGAALGVTAVQWRMRDARAGKDSPATKSRPALVSNSVATFVALPRDLAGRFRFNATVNDGRFHRTMAGRQRGGAGQLPTFLIELCHLLRVPPPDPASGGTGGDYRFERSV